MTGTAQDRETPPRDADAELAASPGRALWTLLRPRQWTKNLLLFAALVFARKLFEPQALLSAVLAFVSFCMVSSSGYALNDVLDVERDRMHPGKRLRPVASGALSPTAALATSVVLGVSGLTLAFTVQPWFGASALLYVALSQFYSIAGKNIVVLDILLVASGFVIRALGGAVAIEVPASSWFVACTLFLSVFLALCKRKAELTSLGEGAGGHRPVLDHYTDPTLRVLVGASMACVLMSYALYVLDVGARAGAAFHPFELTLPFVLYGVFRYYLLVETRGLGGAPEEILLRDAGIRIAVFGFSLVTLAALYAG